MKKLVVNYKPLPTVAYPEDEGFLLRDHQQEIYDAPTVPNRMFVACGGSGKTVTQEACSIKEIRKSGFMQRQLISAPQSQICQQFAKKIMLRLYCTKECFDKKSGRWVCSHKIETWHVRRTDNLADDTSKGVLARLEQFIMRPYATQVSMAAKLKVANSYHGMVAICTHAALTRTYTELIEPKIKSGEYTKAQVKAAVNNLTNRCDESHHVGGLTTVEKADQNGLGRFLSFCHKNRGKNSRMFFTTATPFREVADIVGKDIHFVTTTLPFSEWCHYTGIEQIRLTLEEYTGCTPIPNVAKNVGNEPTEKHLVIDPPDGQKWVVEFEGADEGANIAAMHAMHTAIQSRPSMKSKIIIETITPGTLRKHIKRNLIINPDAADCILTCMLVREGVDVPSIAR